MRHRPAALAATCLAVFSACAVPAAAPPSLPAASGEAVVTLERTQCYGTCPAYTVAAFADGRVMFEGREHTARPGAAEWRVAPAVVAGLVAAAERAGHARASEALAGAVCATDNPAAITTVRTDAGTTQVAHDLGCRGFAGEAALVAFEVEIDRALGTAASVGPR